MHFFIKCSTQFYLQDVERKTYMIHHKNKKVMINVERLDYVDIAKALGIIAVMLSHGIGFPLNTGYFFTASYMALFFCLSGYTYNDKRIVGESIIRRTLKIGRAYFFYSVCLFGLTIVARIALHNGITSDYVLTALEGILYSSYSLYFPRTVEPNLDFFLVQNAPLWYLTCFVVAGVLFDIFHDVVKNYWCVGILGVILLGTFVTYLLAYIPIRLPWGMDTAFAGMVFMAFGYGMRQKNVIQKLWKWHYILFILIIYIGLCTLNPGIAMSVREYGNHGALSVIAFIVIGCLGSIIYIAVAKAISRIPAISKPLCTVGRNTLPILAFHIFIFLVWDTVMERVFSKMGFPLDSSILYCPINIIKLIITIVICIEGSLFWNKMKIRIKREGKV